MPRKRKNKLFFLVKKNRDFMKKNDETLLGDSKIKFHVNEA